MSTLPTFTLDSLLDELADRVAARLATPRSPERIQLQHVESHGAPSRRWVEERARRGEIAIHGPRGARFVLTTDLASLLSATTIARRAVPVLVEATPPATLAEDADDAVIDIAAARRRKRQASR